MTKSGFCFIDKDGRIETIDLRIGERCLFYPLDVLAFEFVKGPVDIYFWIFGNSIIGSH